MLKFNLIVAAFIMSLLVGCGQQDHEKLVLTGSSTVAPLIMVIAEKFEVAHPEVRIDVQTGGSSRGIADVKAALSDIGMVSRGLKPNESQLFAYTIALDGITLIVNRQNPVMNLKQSQIVDIFTGKINNWQAVGGSDQSITVVNKSEGHSTLGLFLEYYQLKNNQIKADIIIGDNQQGLKIVSGNPWAIGYVSIGSAEYEYTQGAPIKLLDVNGIAASTEMVKQGKFPIIRPLNLVTAKESQGLVTQFIKFAQSPVVHDLVKKQYFIPFHEK